MITAANSFRYAAAALMIGACAHIAGHFMGPKAIEFMGAPPDVVQGARDRTCLYYTMIISITGLLTSLAWLAFKKAKQKLPRIILWVFSVIFTVRGAFFLLFIPAILDGSFRPMPLKFWFHFFASIFVLSIGLALVNGLWKTRVRT